MTAALKGAIRNFGFTTALALGAILTAPSAASAQYTLTFDSPQSTNTNNNPIPGTYSFPGVTGTKVTITDGYASGFGVAAVTAGSCGNGTGQDGICVNTDQVFSPASGATAQFHNPKSSSGVGEFIFTPLGGNSAGFVSVVLGESASDAGAELRLYSLDGLTLLATYTDPGLKKSDNKANVPITVSLTDFTFAGGKSATDLTSGYRFEWGATGGGANGVDNIYIDNLIFKSEIAPEPSEMLLLGTGLLALVPLARRRRKKA